jgi:hypothetical protein
MESLAVKRSTGELLIGPSELCGNLTSSHPVPKQGDLGEGNNEFNL